MLGKIVKATVQKAGIEIRRVPDRWMWKTITLHPQKPSQGNVLLSYRTSPFMKGGEKEMRIHTAAWECVQIAQTFLDRGFSVDVIYWLDNQFVPRKEYAFFIDVHSNLERIGPLLNPDCVKILHIVWAHWLFNNQAAYKRHMALFERRGVALKPMRQLEPVQGIENADYATMLGNRFTEGTYAFAGKPILPIPISTQAAYPPPTAKDVETCRRRYLWLGGTGLVHKGLDLLLEIFAAMPEYHLTLCGSISHEKEFVRLYHRELYETPNIKTVGWIDVGSSEFRHIMDSCIALVHPSCSEGQSGSVVNCLHGGLIPLISYESGLDVEDFGHILKTSAISEIKESIEHLSSLSGAELRERSEKAWNYARTNHTREQFGKKYGMAVDTIIGRKN